MLLYLVFLHYAQSTIYATPVPTTPPIGVTATESPLPQIMGPQRTIFTILWSCLATILACTWGSLHPNIPAAKNRGWWERTSQRRIGAVLAIIIPEITVFTAMRQWLGARALARKHKDRLQWTKTHGFFIQMGGFILDDDDSKKEVLSPGNLEILLEKDEKHHFPEITQEEIKGRSKSDSLTKLLVIFQTCWFILQCIARAAQGLSVTELELVTLGFAVFNVLIYFLWWNKPQGINYSVHVQRPKVPEINAQAQDMQVSNTNLGEQFLPIPINNLRGPRPIKISMSHSTSEREIYLSTSGISLEVPSRRIQERTPNIAEQNPGHSIAEGPPSLSPYPIPSLKDFDEKCSTDTESTAEEKPLARFTWTNILDVVRRLKYTYIDVTIGEGDQEVSDLYACLTEDVQEYSIMAITSFVAIFIGGLHFFGWNAIFPTAIEKLLWRIWSIIITVIPVFLLFFVMFSWTCLDVGFHRSGPQMQPPPKAKHWSISSICFKLLSYLFIFCIPAYVIARVGLLVEGLIALRDLHPLERAEIQWINAFPHI